MRLRSGELTRLLVLSQVAHVPVVVDVCPLADVGRKRCDVPPGNFVELS